MSLPTDSQPVWALAGLVLMLAACVVCLLVCCRRRAAERDRLRADRDALQCRIDSLSADVDGLRDARDDADVEREALRKWAECVRSEVPPPRAESAPSPAPPRPLPQSAPPRMPGPGGTPWLPGSGGTPCYQDGPAGDTRFLDAAVHELAIEPLPSNLGCTRVVPEVLREEFAAAIAAISVSDRARLYAEGGLRAIRAEAVRRMTEGTRDGDLHGLGAHEGGDHCPDPRPEPEFG